MVRNKYDQQKRHFRKKLSWRRVEPKRREDKYWAARKDLATPPRERPAECGQPEVTRAPLRLALELVE